jgi:hypothetical protein
MDQDQIVRNADRVSSIFNALALAVLVIGLVAAIGALVSGILQITNDGAGALIGGIVAALVIGVYALITWAGVQLAALVAGYIKVRATSVPTAAAPPPPPPL